MPNQVYEKVRISWSDVEALIDRLVVQLKDQRFDLVLCISRGGLHPAGFLTKRLGYFHVVTASIRGYDENDQKLPEPIVLEFPPDEALRNKDILVIDDVWDTGHVDSIALERVKRAGGRPKIATLYYKPKRDENGGPPDFFAQSTDDWIVYPWEAAEPTG